MDTYRTPADQAGWLPVRRSNSLAALLAAALLASSAFYCTAIDPLPPELEHAPLAAQSAWRERMSRESKSDKEQMARQRHEQRMSYKTALSASLREDAAARVAATRGPAVQASANDELWAENSTGLRWVAIVAGLCGIGYVARRALSPAGG